MRLFLLLLVLFVLSCGGDDDSCKTGDEGCPCFENETCNRGLSCRSKRCVDLGSTDNEEEEGLEDEDDKTDPSEGEEAAGESGSSGEEEATAGKGGATGDEDTSDEGGNTGVNDTSGEGGASGEDSSCTPDCIDRECGPDPVCGESCGNCKAGYDCVSGACISATPIKANSDTCSDDSECASDNCGENLLGERHCYGDSGPNEICSDSFDCASGVCMGDTILGSSMICVEGFRVCMENDVHADCENSTLAFCRLIQECGEVYNISEDYLDFDYCVGSECTTINDGIDDMTPTECRALENTILFGSNVPCP